jgi:hypothetical protein
MELQELTEATKVFEVEQLKEVERWRGKEGGEVKEHVGNR